MNIVHCPYPQIFVKPEIYCPEKRSSLFQNFVMDEKEFMILAPSLSLNFESRALLRWTFALGDYLVPFFVLNVRIIQIQNSTFS
jgi:hypothetical protein